METQTQSPSPPARVDAGGVHGGPVQEEAEELWGKKELWSDDDIALST